MGNTDTWAFFGVMMFFLALGVLLPFINAAFDQPATTQNLNGLPTSSDDLETDTVGILEVLVSVATIIFWSFGQVNLFIDLLILTPLRILAIYLFARMVRGN